MVFELVGFVYTKSIKGYYVLRMNFEENTGIPLSRLSETKFRDDSYWKLYQTEAGNHPHRPIFGVPSDKVWEMYRITS